MQKERRQQQDRHDVAPIEDPVEAIEPAAEGEREHAEERDGEPEEVQRRLVARTPKAHDAADQQREDANAREQEIQRARSARHRRDPDVHDLARAEAQHGVAQGRTVRLPRAAPSRHRIPAAQGDRQSPAADRPASGRPRPRACPSAISDATTPSAVSRHRTPSSISRHVAREAMLARPRQSRTDTTRIGNAGRPHRTRKRNRARVPAEATCDWRLTPDMGENADACCTCRVPLGSKRYTSAGVGFVVVNHVISVCYANSPTKASSLIQRSERLVQTNGRQKRGEKRRASRPALSWQPGGWQPAEHFGVSGPARPLPAACVQNLTVTPPTTRFGGRTTSSSS